MAEPANLCAKCDNKVSPSEDGANAVQIVRHVTIAAGLVAGLWLTASTTLAQDVAGDALSQMKQRISERCEKHMIGLGQDMLDECVEKDFDAMVKLVESYPLKYRRYIHECDKKEGDFGWRNIKACVDRRIAQEHGVTETEPTS